jgi:CTP synthase
MISVGLVGKYVQHQDAYKSVLEALHHGALFAGYKLEVKNIEADKIDTSQTLESQLLGCDGYLVPGGFGERGWMGKIFTAKYCREHNIPYFGICLGMQVMVVEFAREILKLQDANSTEIDPYTKNPIISLLSEQKEISDLGGTMRLGAYQCQLKPSSLAYLAYGESCISERHRHRYEFNNKYLRPMEQAGCRVTGVREEENLCEIVEIKGHPWMLGVQFHPEFKSKPIAPHPLFRDFIKAVIDYKKRAHG